jgi:hypothetical protein
MEDDQIERIRAIQQSMEESARPGFDDKDIQELRILVRLTVEFHDFLTSTPPWPAFPDDPFQNMTYTVDKVLFNIDSFRAVVHSYGVLVGSTRSTIAWNAINIRSLKDEFVSVYQAFVAQTNFESKCRLLLDLVKLEIVFAGAFYDCAP